MNVSGFSIYKNDRVMVASCFFFIALLQCCLVCDGEGVLHPNPVEFAKQLETLSVDGLGTTDMQLYFDSLKFNRIAVDGTQILPALATKLTNKFKEKINIVRKLKDAVETSYSNERTVTSWPHCCVADTSNVLVYDSRFRTKVDLKSVCVRVSGIASSSNPQHLQDNVLRVMQDNMEQYPTIKWQFFGSEEGMYTNYPMLKTGGDCTSFDPRYRPWYVEAATPIPKDVVLVIDISGSMSKSGRLSIAKDAAKTVLDTLNPRDRIGVIAFESNIHLPGSTGDKKDSCFALGLADASPVNIDILKKFVDSRHSGGGTEYIKAFNGAFDLLHYNQFRQSSNQTKRQPVILFMTDGQPSESEDAILRFVRVRNTQLITKSAILTFGMGPDIGSGGKILADLASQGGDTGSIGKYTAVPNSKNLRNKMATYYELFSKQGRHDEAIASIPYVDALGLGLVTSITFPCFLRGKFIGVVGTDITMSDILADVTYFNQGQASYGFVADSSGRTMMHPLLTKPSHVNEAPFFVHISDLEPERNFSTVFQGIKSGTPGVKNIYTSRFLSRGGSLYEGVTVKRLPSTYYWKPIQETNFTLCLVVKDDDHYDTMNSVTRPARGFSFLYHRLDLNNKTSLCQYFGNSAVKDQSVVKFGPQAFNNPYEYLGIEESRQTVKGYAAYFEGRTNTHTQFKESIRNSVFATYKAEQIWLKSKTGLSRYVVWRYIGTREGVFRMFPGASLPKGFDATSRPWYQTAVSNIGKTSISTPYVDAAGAGLVITVAHTIYKGSGENKHTTADDVMAVMGADFPITYLKKLLTDSYAKCQSTKNSCFVMDRGGFLIYHESFMSPTIKSNDVEQIHITSKEKQLSQHMINNRLLVRRECRNIAKIQTVHFYDVNVSNSMAFSETVFGCTMNYNIHPIIGTNAFLGVIKTEGSCSNDVGCTCSKDKINQPCLSVVQSQTCECPCSSKLDFNYCDNKYPESKIPICPVPAQILSGNEENAPCVKSDLPKCFDPKCNIRPSVHTCEGRVGCSWCFKDKTNALLSRPYCTDISNCIGGREGSKAPVSGTRNVCKSKTDVTVTATVTVTVTDDTPGSGGKLSSGAIVGISIGVFLLIIIVIAVAVKTAKHNRKMRQEHPNAVSTGRNEMVQQTPTAPYPNVWLGDPLPYGPHVAAHNPPPYGPHVAAHNPPPYGPHVAANNPPPYESTAAYVNTSYKVTT